MENNKINYIKKNVSIDYINTYNYFIYKKSNINYIININVYTHNHVILHTKQLLFMNEKSAG